MSATPEVPGSGGNKNKNSPYSWNGINKSLLTPCRQVGLSRKRKTPVSNFAKCVSEDLSSNNSSKNSSFENEVTPVAHNKFKRKKGSNSLANENLLENCDIKCSKKNSLQTFTSEELFDYNDDNQSCSIQENTVIEDKEKTPLCLVSEVNETPKECVTNKNNLESDLDVRKLKKKRLASHFLNFENEKSQTTIISDDTEDNFVIDKLNKKKEDLNDEETKCVEQVTNVFEGNSKEKNCIKNCKIKLQKLSEEEIHTSSNQYTDEKICVKTLKIKTNSSDVIDDADFFTSTPEREKLKRKSIEKKVRLLESQVRQKQSILENLQRASIYKNKHNIQDLQKLTAVWLDGCVQALRDLLTHLQAHGPIDLVTLLNNMRIPKEIVDKLPL